MDELSIKISIAGRTYPLTIDRNEEELIRKAAKDIDEKVRTFQQNYAVKDKQDLLAMTALQMASGALKLSSGNESEQHAERLLQLEKSVDDYLTWTSRSAAWYAVVSLKLT